MIVICPKVLFQQFAQVFFHFFCCLIWIIINRTVTKTPTQKGTIILFQFEGIFFKFKTSIEFREKFVNFQKKKKFSCSTFIRKIKWSPYSLEIHPFIHTVSVIYTCKIVSCQYREDAKKFGIILYIYIYMNLCIGPAFGTNKPIGPAKKKEKIFPWSMFVCVCVWFHMWN